MSQDPTPKAGETSPDNTPAPVVSADAATAAEPAAETSAVKGFAGTKLSKETIILLLVVEGVFFLALVWYLVQPKDKPTQELAEKWLAAVHNSDYQVAAETANEMVSQDTDKLVNPVYRSLAQSSGMNPQFLEWPFNQADAMAWDQSAFFHAKARDLLQDLKPDQDPIHVLIKGLWDQVTVEPDSQQTVEWLVPGWKRGRATAEHMAWMAAELGYQVGFEVLVLRLNDAEGQAVAYMCEMRHAQGYVYLADPGHGTLIKNSLNNLLALPEVVAENWKDIPGIFEAMSRAQYFVPAMPQDYCLRNQKLAEYLGRFLGDSMPRFGQDPFERARLHRLAWGSEMPSQEFPVNLWDEPFNLLVKDLQSQIAQP
jgi:hypothetical protein